VSAARERIAGQALTVVDVGTGSGAIRAKSRPRECARHRDGQLARRARCRGSNALANGVADRIEFRTVICSRRSPSASTRVREPSNLTDASVARGVGERARSRSSARGGSW